uniref:Peptidase A2 domain-containing protein n=1 Tax=Caenorhabditis japonica TaxID=281687 RepID=A0A8R1DXK8_CAEJA
MQGSPEALTHIVSAHSDPASGPLASTDFKKMFNLWERVLQVWGVVFYCWTLLVNVVVTGIVAVAVFLGLVRLYVGPWLISLRNRNSKPVNGATENPTTTTGPSPSQAAREIAIPIQINPETQFTTPPIPDCSRALKRLRPPRTNVLNFTDPKFFTAQIPVKANGVSCWALIDTGAGFTVASRSVCPLFGISRLNAPSVEHALGLGGNEVEMAGSATVQFNIGSITLLQTTNFTSGQCTPEGARDYDFILGNDILRRLPKFNLNYNKGCFEMGEEKLPLGARKDESVFPSRYALHISADTVIPPRSESFVRCATLPNDHSPDLVLLSQANNLTKLDLLVAPAVFKAQNPILLITNPTNESKTLYANSTAAVATDINEETESPSVFFLTHAHSRSTHRPKSTPNFVLTSLRQK